MTDSLTRKHGLRKHGTTDETSLAVSGTKKIGNARSITLSGEQLDGLAVYNVYAVTGASLQRVQSWHSWEKIGARKCARSDGRSKLAVMCCACMRTWMELTLIERDPPTTGAALSGFPLPSIPLPLRLFPCLRFGISDPPYMSSVHIWHLSSTFLIQATPVLPHCGRCKRKPPWACTIEEANLLAQREGHSLLPLSSRPFLNRVEFAFTPKQSRLRSRLPQAVDALAIVHGDEQTRLSRKPFGWKSGVDLSVTKLRTSLHDLIRNSNSSLMSVAYFVHFGWEKTNHCVPPSWVWL